MGGPVFRDGGCDQRVAPDAPQTSSCPRDSRYGRALASRIAPPPGSHCCAGLANRRPSPAAVRPAPGHRRGPTRALLRCSNANRQHQAVRPHLDTPLVMPLRHQFDVSPVVVLAEERLLPTISPLGDMTRQTSHNQSGGSRHAATGSNLVQSANIGSCPRSHLRRGGHGAESPFAAIRFSNPCQAEMDCSRFSRRSPFTP